MDSALQLSRRNINSNYVIDETQAVQYLLEHPVYDASISAEIHQQCQKLILQLRQNQQQQNLVDSFMREYDLSSKEGIVLMCLAEAMLRIPDTLTLDNFIQDKLLHGDWQQHLGHSPSRFVNASTWGLLLSGNIVRPKLTTDSAKNIFTSLVKKIGEPMVRNGLFQAMKILGHQFVMGESIQTAIKRSAQQSNYRFSYDMLGEAALTEKDADYYLSRYHHALDELAKQPDSSLFEKAGLSIKLSALHPRYEETQRQRVCDELTEKLLPLIEIAKQHQISVTIDAEESDRLELSLDILEQLLRSPTLEGFHGLGLAVQAYQKRATKLLFWLKNLALDLKLRIPIRLVKGAYWDTEIKRAQERGLDDYPVFTCKEHTDISYLYCAKFLLDHPDCFYPQFATHNAHTAAAIVSMGKDSEYEFQRLHGMGHGLHDELVKQVPSRIYAPVGSHQQLLPYLVRRLLENGANTSFVNKLDNPDIDPKQLSIDPYQAVNPSRLRNIAIPYPRDLFQQQRQSAPGLLIADRQQMATYYEQLNPFQFCQWQAGSIIHGETLQQGSARQIISPADPKDEVGQVFSCSDTHIEQAALLANQAVPSWASTPVSTRSKIVQEIGEQILQQQHELIALIIRETGRTLQDAHNEIREAVDFCRYYASLALELQQNGQELQGPTGERNTLYHEPKGVFVCISPWNFPVAIFTGQIVAALVTGNTVIAKPASAACMCAHVLVTLMHKAGVPTQALSLLTASAAQVEQVLLCRKDIQGVTFTGSVAAAHQINRTLASRDGALATFVAETGGQNVMFVDSSALPEQVVIDALDSAFNSAGQRCSALRVLYVPTDTADHIIELLRGALALRTLGHPWALSTDIGPVIDLKAKKTIQQHIEQLKQQQKLIAHLDCPQQHCYLAPHIFEIDSLEILQQEVFGPVLHVIRYKASELERHLQQVNQLGYGLTLGVHSRVDSFIDKIRQSARVGNIYVNRNIIGAVVGVQPFGGQGLSGTGPKAGGPNYLRHFTTEKTVTINTAAVGGNAELLSQGTQS